MNTIITSGRLGQDAEMKYTPKGTALCKFSLAITKRIGEGKAKTIWIESVLWGKLAESVGKYLNKGTKVTVKGELDQQEWKNNEGQKRSRYLINVQEIDIHFDNDKKSKPTQEQQSKPQLQQDNMFEQDFAPSFNEQYTSDDIPF